MNINEKIDIICSRIKNLEAEFGLIMEYINSNQITNQERKNKDQEIQIIVRKINALKAELEPMCGDVKKSMHENFFNPNPLTNQG